MIAPVRLNPWLRLWNYLHSSENIEPLRAVRSGTKLKNMDVELKVGTSPLQRNGKPKESQRKKNHHENQARYGAPWRPARSLARREEV